MASHKGCAGEVEHQAPIHFRIEGEVEGLEGLVLVTESGLLFSALEQAIAATIQFTVTRQERKSRGGMGSACAWCRRVSYTATIFACAGALPVLPTIDPARPQATCGTLLRPLAITL